MSFLSDFFQSKSLPNQTELHQKKFVKGGRCETSLLSIETLTLIDHNKEVVVDRNMEGKVEKRTIHLAPPMGGVGEKSGISPRL